MQVLDIHDLDAANAVLRTQYTVTRLSPTDTRRTLRIEQRQLGAIGLNRFAFGMAADVEGDPLGHAWIGRVHRGSVRYGHDAATSHRAGSVVLAARPDAPWQARLDDLDAEWALVDPVLLNQVAQPRDVGRSVRFTGYTPTSDESARRWCTTYAFVLALAAEASTNPLMADAGARLLVASALVTIPNNARFEPDALDRRDAHSDTLRRAVAFIDANPHRPISTAEIARAAHVTIRAVQFAFRRQLDTTPMAYVRRARLDSAHAELRDGTPLTTTVGAVSARWGFLSSSQFAAKYRAAHGESPSATLRR